eukprot:scaffold457_cov50-Attheya_sp.AAC.4
MPVILPLCRDDIAHSYRHGHYWGVSIANNGRHTHSPLHGTVHPVASDSRPVYARVLRLSDLCAELGERDTKRLTRRRCEASMSAISCSTRSDVAKQLVAALPRFITIGNPCTYN